MIKFQAQAICDRLNSNRAVKFHNLFPASAENYWEHCSTMGNFLINGGNEDERIEMLMRKLEHLQDNSNIPVILLTTSSETEAALIREANEGRLTGVTVSSPQYKNYHALYGMDTEQILTLMTSVGNALTLGETTSLRNYIEAFIEIGRRYYPPTLASLSELNRSNPTAGHLRALGRTAGIPDFMIEAINSYPQGSTHISSILNRLNSCYASIGAQGSDNPHNILVGCRNRRIVCVRVNSIFPETMDVCIGAELRQLLSTGQNFHLILNDVPLPSVDGILQPFIEAKNYSSNTTVGICNRNVAGWAAQIAQAHLRLEDLLTNINQFVLFYSGGGSPADFAHVASVFGEYLHHEIQPAPGNGIFHQDWTVVGAGMKPIVLPEDMDGYRVLLSGHNGRMIHIYKDIRLQSTKANNTLIQQG